MRKPLIALGLAVTAGLGAIPAADVLAAQTAVPPLSSRTGATQSPQAPTGSTRSTTLATTGTSSRANDVSGAAIVNFALRYLGYPYTATGNSPSTGFSCIGFVSYVYRSLGIPLPGDLGGAMAYAPEVPFSQLEPGDILYFQNTVWNGLSHAAIYIGGGRFVHSEWYGYGVRISSFNNDPKDGNYWIQHYLGANRPWGGAAGAPVVNVPTGSTVRSTAPAASSVTAPTTTTVGPVAGGKPAVVTVTSLNVRSGPGLNRTRVTVVVRGSSVSIIGQSHGWYKVQLPNGEIGWVIKSGVSRGATATAATTNPNVQAQTAPARANQVSTTRPRAAGKAPAHAVMTSARVALNVHAAPGFNAAVIGGLAPGEKVQVLARRNGWTKVRLPNGQVGWIDSAYTTARAKTATGGSAAKSAARSVKPAARTTAVGNYVLTAGVRVHSSPGINAPVVTMAGAGTRVTVLNYSNGWTLVRLPSGQTGWVSSAYTRAAGSTTSAKSSARIGSRGRVVKTGPVLTAGVRVHSSPGINAPVVGMATAGTHVTILGASNGWTLVRLPNGRRGWVDSLYVRA